MQETSDSGGRCCRFTTAVVLVIAVFLCVAGHGGLFKVLEDRVYDILIRQSAWMERESDVLVVEVDYAHHADVTSADDLQYLESLGPAAVVFTHFPKDADTNFYAAAQSLGNVFFGRKVQHASDSSDLILVPLPPSASGTELKTGLFLVPPGDHGIHRAQRMHYEIGGRFRQTIEAVVVDAVGPARPVPASARFYVDFRGPRHGIPRVHNDRLVARDVLPQMASNKVVLVGHVHEMDIPGLSTPQTPGHDMMDALEFHAYAIDTLLKGLYIREVPRVVAYMAGILIAFGSLLLLRYLSMRGALLVTLLLFVLQVLVAAGCLYGFSIRWPAAQMITIQLAVAGLSLAVRVRSSQMLVNTALMGISETLHERIAVPGEYHSQAHLSHALLFATRLLWLERSVILIRDSAGRRIADVVTCDCAPEDIAEKRHDTRRAPFADGLATAPTRMRRPFFSSVPDGHSEFIVALQFAGNLEGYWVFVASSERGAGSSKSTPLVSNMAGLFAELLYHRRDAAMSNLSLAARIGRSGSGLRHATTRQALLQAVGLADRRLSDLERLFDQRGEPTAWYDFLGNALRLNRRMEQLLTETGVQALDADLTDLLATLTGKPVTEVNATLARALNSDQTERMSGTMQCEGETRQATILVTPLTQDDVTGDVHGRAVPSGGFLCQISEVTGIERTMRLRCGLQKAILERMGEALAVSENETGGAALVGELQRLVAVSCEYLTVGSGSFDVPAVYPVNLDAELKHAVERAAAVAAERRITVRFEGKTEAYVQAGPEELPRLLDRLLGFLVGDGLDESGICITASREDGIAVCEFSNEGFGIPDRSFQKYLSAQGDDPAFAELCQSIEAVRQWHAELTGSSEVGHGTRFLLKLDVVV